MKQTTTKSKSRTKVKPAALKENVKAAPTSSPPQQRGMPLNEQQNLMRYMVENASLTRRNIMAKLFDDRRDIDVECGYPKDIDPIQYRYLYDREGIATRVVSIYPEESWVVDPEVIETEDPDDTEFEKAWKTLEEQMMVYHYMHRIDELSGIAEFGIILLGLNDGQELKMPAVGIDEKGIKTGDASAELLYLRVFDQSVVTIQAREVDQANPRYGLPTMYQVRFADVDVTASSAATTTTLKSMDVHWSRVIHIADNRKMSEIFGVPRIRPVFNRIYDIRKVLSGSGEMFWKGAFPGYAFEIDPEIGDADIDTTALREEFEVYSNGLQRYIALQGMKVNSLAPQVADPSAHVASQLKVIAISMGVPTRIMFGSEEAKLASTQDAKTWNKRIARRQNKYLSPMVLRPFIDRLIALGVLPEPKDEQFHIEWPDLNVPTDEDKAKVAELRTKALGTYIQGNVSQIIPPEEFLKMIFGLNVEEVKQIMDAAEKFTEEEDLEDDDPPVPPPPEPEDDEDDLGEVDA